MEQQRESEKETKDDDVSPAERIRRLEPLVQRDLLQLARRTGWLRSAIGKLPVDANGDPLPWYTYGAIHFLARRIKPEFKVFEFGSGNSTLWWAKRVAHVTSVEHSGKWYNRFTRRMPPNVTYQHHRLADGNYVGAAAATGGKFDVIVIDGRDRVNCAKNIREALHDRSVVVWDNADREIYAEGYTHLAELGFRQIEFTGPGPMNAKEWTTAVFYRAENCLGI